MKNKYNSIPYGNTSAYEPPNEGGVSSKYTKLEACAETINWFSHDDSFVKTLRKHSDNSYSQVKDIFSFLNQIACDLYHIITQFLKAHIAA